MNHKHLLFILALLIPLLLAACGGDGYYTDEEASYDEPLIVESDPPCLPEETYDETLDVCIMEFYCTTDAECDAMVEEFYATADAAFADETAANGGCLEDEIYDPVDDVCYVICETEEECAAFDTGFYGLFDDFGIDGFLSGTQTFVEDTFSDSEENYIVSYTVSGNTISDPVTDPDLPDEYLTYADDTGTHEAIWNYFATLIPQERRADIGKFTIFTDGFEGTLAAISPDYEDPSYWELVVDIEDAENPEELTYTLLHEYGHLLTLGDDQVELNVALLDAYEGDAVYEEAAATCPTYFTGYEGCSFADSYINAYVDRFWLDILPEWQGVAEDDYDTLDELYYKYEDYFVSDYAATNVAEDIAESFTHFVLKEKPAGNTIAEQKILFFYEYPELVKLRDTIRGRTYTRLRSFEK